MGLGGGQALVKDLNEVEISSENGNSRKRSTRLAYDDRDFKSDDTVEDVAAEAMRLEKFGDVGQGEGLASVNGRTWSRELKANRRPAPASGT